MEDRRPPLQDPFHSVDGERVEEKGTEIELSPSARVVSYPYFLRYWDIAPLWMLLELNLTLKCF